MAEIANVLHNLPQDSRAITFINQIT